MNSPLILLQRFRALFHKTSLERELDDEIRSHIELQIEEEIARGMNPIDARAAALKKFGGVEQVKEQYRDRRGLPAIETLFQDLRHASRLFRRNPLIASVAILTLALGIGANTAIFSVINAVILQPLPYHEADRLLVLWGKLKRADQVEQSPTDFAALVERSHSFEQLAATERANYNLTGSGDPVRVEGQRATANLAAILGVEPLLGRFFTDDEDRSEAQVAVLSHSFWKSRFASDSSAIGRSISLNGASFVVIGVMPPTFEYPAPIGSRADIWTPRSLAAERQRDAHNLLVIARLRKETTVEQARAELASINEHRAKEAGRPSGEYSVYPVVLTSQVGRKQRTALYVLAAAVGFVLLIACANVANLLLALAAGRRREMSVRLALGAQRMRIVRQLLTESIFLSLLGAALGLLMAVWLAGVIRVLAAGQLPRVETIALDGRVLFFTLLVAMLTGVTFGLAPALQAVRSDLNSALKDGTRSATGAIGQRLRSALVVVEIGMALVLLTGAGLMLKSFWKMQQVEPGFDTHNLLSVEMTLPASRYPDEKARRSFFERALAQVSTIPGVEGAALINNPPLGGRRGISIFPIEGHPRATSMDGAPLADFRFVSPGYFELMKIRLIDGRVLTEADTDSSAKVMVVNAAYRDRYAAPGEQLLGKRVQIDDEWYTVVGVVADIRQSGLEEEAAPHVYASYKQVNGARTGLLLRTTVQPESLTGSVRAQIRGVDAELPIYNVNTMSDLLEASSAPRRLNLTLMAGFAGLALLLASVGIYGVIANLVTQRTGEIGVRIALGARPRDVLAIVIGQAMKLALLGVLLGIAGSLTLTRALTSLLFEVSTTDPAIFVVVALLLAMVSLVACWIPARRAMRVDPMIALRYE
jgi:putative ABC transport system permease protein